MEVYVGTKQMSSSLSFAQSAGTHLCQIFHLQLQILICNFSHISCTDELMTVICKEEISFIYWGYRVLVPARNLRPMFNYFLLITKF